MSDKDKQIINDINAQIDITYYLQLIRTVLVETNVKQFVVGGYKSEKGDINAVVTMEDAWVEVGGQKTDAPQTLLLLLSGVFQQ